MDTRLTLNFWNPVSKYIKLGSGIGLGTTLGGLVHLNSSSIDEKHATCANAIVPLETKLKGVKYALGTQKNVVLNDRLYDITNPIQNKLLVGEISSIKADILHLKCESALYPGVVIRDVESVCNSTRTLDAVENYESKFSSSLEPSNIKAEFNIPSVENCIPDTETISTLSEMTERLF